MSRVFISLSLTDLEGSPEMFLRIQERESQPQPVFASMLPSTGLFDPPDTTRRSDIIEAVRERGGRGGVVSARWKEHTRLRYTYTHSTF